MLNLQIFSFVTEIEVHFVSKNEYDKHRLFTNISALCRIIKKKSPEKSVYFSNMLHTGLLTLQTLHIYLVE